jgi:diguanylate cyclase (GGDEF)-like protein/PAS domain S-box-containing protein
MTARAATAATRILFADDEPGTRAMMRAALRKLGMTVTVAADGAEAVQRFREAPHDMVLLDVEMPALDGFEVCRLLRREAGALLPIVMVTGMDDVGSIERAYEAGATDFFSKPINWALLGHRLRHLLRNAQTAQELKRAESRNQAILDALPDLLLELDGEGRFVDSHAAGTSSLAGPLRALTGRKLVEALPAGLLDVAQAAIGEAAERGVSTGRQCSLRVGAQANWFELSVARKADDGSGPRFIVLARDITERKQAESRIDELAESLRVANTDLRKANGELQRRAFEDPLCGLPNRALFHDRLQHALQRHARRNASADADADAEPCVCMAVLFIDLDGFKPINDSFGHAAGDEVLREVARRLRAVVRESDTLARLGGDEFVALVESIKVEEDAMLLGRRVIDVLRRPFVIGDQQVSLSCSIGVVAHPGLDSSGHRLLACADAAMYAAKRMGGGTCVLYQPGMSEDGTEQVLMQQALRESIERGELALHYQPKLESERGHVRGLEALLRWSHARFGQVGPGVFIPLAERFGLIGSIGNWVIDEACAQLAAWHAQGLHCHVAINLSPHQLRQEDLAGRIQQALQRHGLQPSQLVCEITETAMMEHTHEERGMLERIAALGVRLAIDDFGMGYSSLAHLRHIPARQLKIDRSFVVDLADSPQARAVLEAVVRLAHQLEMEVVAEGVETEEQLQVLRELKCDQLQGFYIARPMPADAVPAWMATREHARREGRDTSFGD